MRAEGSGAGGAPPANLSQATASAPQLAAPGTVEDIRLARRLSCGVVMEPDDWDRTERHGDLDPLGQEICKAVSVVLLGQDARIAVHQYATEANALDGLRRHEVTMVAGVTPTPSAQVEFGVRFGPTIFYDAQGFLVDRNAGIAHLADLAGHQICALDGTEADDTAAAELTRRHIDFHPFPFTEQGEMDGALVGQHCQAETADISKLAFSRMQFRGRRPDFVLLPETITIDPIAVAYRADDLRFGTIVDWTIHALVQAEASGLTAQNVASHRQDTDPATKRLLGSDFYAGRALGLDAGWAARLIATLGNYGEIYARTVGDRSPLEIPRRLNALWTDGGLMRPLPVR